MNKLLLIVFCFLLLLIGCTNNSNDDRLYNTKDSNSTSQNIDAMESDLEVSNIKVVINNKSYTLKLENNSTVEGFINLLPHEFTMSELNGNEKYAYIDSILPTNLFNPKRVEKGDVMLYGDNCLVIFYKSFDTSYSYTKIGHIDNLENLENGSITVKFEK